MVKFLLDTNVISEPQKPNPNANVLRRLKEHEGQMAICSITWHEVMYGVERLPAGPKQNRLRAYFTMIQKAVPILPYDDRAAVWHAVERTRLKKTAPFVDGQIAAIAATNDLTLVTSDADFAPFAVKSANWMK